jgi:hypothetical protein
MKLPKLPNLAALWKREPVLVTSVLPLLVTAGVLTTDQASALQNGISAAIAVVVDVVAAFVSRSRVSPVKAADPNVTAPLPPVPPAVK